MTPDVHQRIDAIVKNHAVVLFMKGTAQFPQCGFSGRAIQVLKACGVGGAALKTVNVLEDEEIRQGIKDYAQWPTIPQLYVNGEFVGGSDILMEMYQSGELQPLLQPASDGPSGPRPPPRVVVGLTGATGAVYAVRLLSRLRTLGAETHLVATPAGVLNAHHELDLDRRGLEALADVAYAPGDVGAAIASGSFPTSAMVVAPCSMRTLAAVAHGLSDNLLTRAADVALKERRRLVLMVRETPLNLAHLRNMVAVTEMGAVVFPPLPAFYHRPASLDAVVDDTVERVLGLLGQDGADARTWTGLPGTADR